MSEPRDDELRSMLEARADRLPASAVDAVRAAVRDEMRTAPGGATFAVLPVTTRGRGAKAPAGWAALALVAVLVLAVTGGRLDLGTAPPGSSTAPTAASSGPSLVAVVPGGTSTSGASPATVAPASPAVSALPRLPIMTAAQLVAALADGSLDGRLVLVAGRLKVLALPCPYPVPPDCFGITVSGLDNVSMTWDGKLSRDGAAAMQGGLAFVVRGSTLVFAGRVTSNLSEPLELLQLVDLPVSDTAPDPFALTPVGGWLVVGGIHSCPAMRPGASPCSGPGPRLTDVQPGADGIINSDLQVPVDLAASVPGVRAGSIVTPGPFLVRTEQAPGCRDLKTVDLTACLSVKPPTLRVIAGYDPATTVRVSQVQDTCALPGYGVTTTLACDAALVAALDVVPADTSIVSLDFAYGGGCPPWVRCLPGLAITDAGHVVVHVASPGPDLWVVVVADETGVVTAATPVPFPARWGTPSPTP